MAPVFRVLSISLVFKIDNRLVDCFFRSLNYVRYGFYFRCMGLLLTLLGIYLGSRIGIIYVATGVVVANVITILSKISFLSSKIKCKLSLLIRVWLRAWRPSIVPLLLGSLFLLVFNHTSLLVIISFAIVYAFCLAVEAVFFPTLFGSEYQRIIYPFIDSLLSKLKHN